MKHPHHDLIMQWAKNPTRLQVQYKDARDQWHTTAEPAWHSGTEYRVVPKEIPTFGSIKAGTQFKIGSNRVVFTKHVIPADWYGNTRASKQDRSFAITSTGIARISADTEVTVLLHAQP